MPLTNRNIVRQSNALNNARYSLNAVETDFVLKMIAEIKKEDPDFKPYKFKVTELETYFGKKLNRSTIKTMAHELRRKNLEIERENGGFLVTGWVSSFEYFPEKGEIEMSFDPKLKPYLLELQGSYVLTDLRHILQLSSEYAKRIYGIMKQWQDFGKKEIEVAHWQKILEVPKSMLNYADFKRKVIEVAVAQINEKTDLIVSYEPVKKDGRKVTHLLWTIKAKPTAKQLTIDAVSTDEIDTRISPASMARIVAKCRKAMPLTDRDLTTAIKREVQFECCFDADKALIKSIKSEVKR